MVVPIVPAPRRSNERQQMYMLKATQAAMRSDMGERHGCVIVDDGGAIIATGHNHTSVNMCHSSSVHAEMDALRRCYSYKKNSLMSAEMYVVRIGPESRGHPLKLSKPCDSCRAQIERSGIGKVFYSWSHIDYSVNKRSHDRYT